MVSAYDDNIAIAITGPRPGLLQSLEPIYAALDLSDGTQVGEVTSMNENLAWR